jgi:hypothetical protein
VLQQALVQMVMQPSDIQLPALGDTLPHITKPTNWEGGTRTHLSTEEIKANWCFKVGDNMNMFMQCRLWLL